MKFTPRQLTWVICIQSLLAILGSLYYSNFGDYAVNLTAGQLFDPANALAPCQLCWWARIFMYPIFPISVVALLRKQYDFVYYVVPLVLAGIGLELYHYYIQMVPTETSFACSLSNPCDALKVKYFGFITIPLQCLVAFIVIGKACSSLISRREITF